jgi:hypothetical protein
MFDAGGLSELAPGPASARLLDSRMPAGLDDDGLIDAIQGWDRLASWVAARQFEAIAELARRRPRDLLDRREGRVDAGHPGLPQVSEFAVDELAAALRLSRPAAGARLALAVELSRLPGTATALHEGAIDLPKARAMTEATAPLPDPTAVVVEEKVLPEAREQTVGRLRTALARAVLAADPTAADERHERAVAWREVTVRPLPDGMAGLWALLPADGAAALYATLDRMARDLLTTDPRGMDARRADALLELTIGRRSPDEAGPGAVLVHVTVPATTALGLDDQPGELDGFGPVPASMARRLASADAATWRLVTTHARTGPAVDPGSTAYSPSAALADLVRIRDRTCRFPGCRQPSRRCDLDHVVPWPEGPTSAGNLAALCRHHHRLKHQTGWRVRVGVDAALTWTSPTGRRYTTTPGDP